MVAIGIISIVVSLVGVIVGQRVIGQVESSVDDSLVLTNQALEVVVDSIQTTSTIVTTVRSGVSSISATLDTLNTSIGDTTTAIEGSTDFLGTSLPQALDAVSNVLPTIESVARSVDSALRVISQAPFGPDYNPAKPFDQASEAAEELAAAGRAQVRAAERLALWLGWSVALIPILGALLLYLPPRVRFVRRAAAGRGLVDSAADLDLFALRALAHQSLPRLAAISDDPAAAWRQKDTETIRRLAALELAAVGLTTDSGTRSA